MGKTMNQDIEKIRHFQGTVADFKNFFDQKAAETAKDTDEANTNSYGTPEYQGFNDVHPTRGANASPHWEESVNEESPDHTSGLTIKGRGFDWKKSKDTKLKKGQDVIVQDVHDPRYKKYNGKKGQITDILKWSEGSPSYSVKIRGKEIEFNGFELKLDESNSTSTKADRLPLFEDFQG